MALMCQALHDGHGERGFAAAARHHIAHHNDSGWELVCSDETQGEQCAPNKPSQFVKQFDGPQQTGDDRSGLPMKWQLMKPLHGKSLSK
jgi:hypothetical protein